MTMTAEAKARLSRTIRSLREWLLTELHEATDREYRMSVRARDVRLSQAQATRRKRLEQWLAEQERTQSGRHRRSRDDFRREAEKQAAYTLLNRIVILRIMEATGLRSPRVAIGGWDSRGYRDFRELAPALVRGDASEGYAFLLQLIFEDLATDLPGLYGPAGIAELIPVPAPTLRAVVEALDDSALESCWTDDMTLGWVYQYWNDPEREDLDVRIKEGGKIEPHEIASKTQMFTERYMVDWLLQNSLGPMWLAICRRNGWTPEVQADGTLDRLEERRTDWRDRREAGEVELTELMPLHTDAERRWAYHVPQPIPDNAIEHAPQSVRDLKILDPAVGSGHFLVVAFDLLLALYREEARHRGQESQPEWSDAAIVERILEHNLHGIDLDPRAVQIAAAALWLKAQRACDQARPRQMHLVASNLEIAGLPDDDPALVELRQAVQEETGIPARLTDQIIEALRGADHLGSLLKVDAAIEAAIRGYEEETGWREKVTQIDLFPVGHSEPRPHPINREWAESGILAALERFLSRHPGGGDLGLRLHGEQLAAGVRFVRMVREDTYDLVVANPPYQGTSRMAEAGYVQREYPLAKADLFAAFLLRGLQLVRPHGVSAMLTMRNWMFIKQYSKLRQHLLETFDLRALGDFDRGAFEDIPDEVVAVCVAVFQKQTSQATAIAQLPTPRDDTTRDSERTQRKRAATLCHVGRCEFAPAALKVVPEWPLVYWWDEALLHAYRQYDLLGEVVRVRSGMQTGDNARFVRRTYEIHRNWLYLEKHAAPPSVESPHYRFVPYIQGSQGRKWFEPCVAALRWAPHNLAVSVLSETRAGTVVRNTDAFFTMGVAFTPIGASLTARGHRFSSVCDTMGASLFGAEPLQALVLLNSAWANEVVCGLNPTVHFQVGDLSRIPFRRDEYAKQVSSELDSAFTTHESHREPSVEFQQPGPSPWRYAQEWAQRAVDRAEGAPLPEYVEQLDPEPPTDHLSFALGVALGRFGPHGEGVRDPDTDDLTHALPHGILFLDGTLAADDPPTDSFAHPAADVLHQAWATHGPQIAARSSLRDWLRLKFFKDVHKGMYENRPIHWPLTSARRTFVAWVTIHRWTGQTLKLLLADHLKPVLRRLDGELDDLTAARSSGDRSTARSAESRYDDVRGWRDELDGLITLVEQCANHGPPPPHPDQPEREADAPYEPDLDDGVMINSAALWPLLEPQWKDPQKWWKELVAARGRKDYDWSHLAMRYWPTRVDEKCQSDPSLAVAHGCFWKYHPARGWAWELRLQDEIGPEFHIEEASYRGDSGDGEHRTAWLTDHAAEAVEIIEKEVLRRRRKQGAPQSELKLQEPGLWSNCPAECYELEGRIIRKQEAPFRLAAPDEADARAEYEQQHPEEAQARRRLLQSVTAESLTDDSPDGEDAA